MNPKPRSINLLRAHRKRSALSQDDVAFLMGAQGASKVSRYEQLVREPELKTALAYEVIFQKPVSELFPGLFKKIKASVEERAKALARRAIQGASKKLISQRRSSISRIITNKAKKNDQEQK